ncbi:MAG: hypothetical protein KJO06_08495 [Gemmatimonadetes bacterium]|nr:hypothetical protein [Gemmatimonadota bacterium]
MSPLVLLSTLAGCSGAVPEPEVESPRRALGNITTTENLESCRGSRCFLFEVESPELGEAATGEIVVSDPVGASRGTVVSFSGGAGTGLRGGPDIEAWIEAGFRVARVQWDANWWAGSSPSEGFAALACRPATVTDWVAEHLVDDGQPLCVEGGSGGAGQVAYGLTHYGLEDVVSLAVPWTGFWMGRIDLGCLDADPLNADLHYDEVARRAIDYTYGFAQDEDGPCFRRDEAFRAAFAEASTAVEADLHHPNTMVWHILAGADAVGALGHGLSYYDAMLRAGSPLVRADVIQGAPHGLDEEGRARVRDVILRECVAR